MNFLAHKIHKSNWLFLFVLAMFFALALPFQSFTIDDAYISYRYARNFSAGYGLVFNPGEYIEGYSNFLWVLILAALHKIGIDIVFCAKLLSGILASLCLLFVWHNHKDAPNISPRLQATLFLALSPCFLMWTAGGLETTFFAFLVLLAGSLYIQETKSRAHPWGGVIWALVALTRPEGFGLFLVTLTHRLLCHTRSFAQLRHTVKWACVFLLCFGSFLCWRHYYYGAWLPNTFFAKTGDTAAQILAGIKYAAYYLIGDSKHIFLLTICLAVTAILYATRHMSQALVELFYWGSLMAGYFFFIIIVGGDWMPGYRFFAHILPVMAITWGKGVSYIATTIGQIGPPQKAKQRQQIAGALIWGVFCLQIFASTPFLFHAHKLAMQVAANDQLQTSCARWLRTKVPPNALLAVTDAGIYPFYTGLPTLDMVGLMDAHIARLPGKLHEKFDLAYVLNRKPDIIQTHLSSSLMLPCASVNADMPTFAAKQCVFFALPHNLSIKSLAEHACWRGDYELYSSPQFAETYQPLLICKSPGSNYSLLFIRKDAPFAQKP